MLVVVVLVPFCGARRLARSLLLVVLVPFAFFLKNNALFPKELE